MNYFFVYRAPKGAFSFLIVIASTRSNPELRSEDGLPRLVHLAMTEKS